MRKPPSQKPSQKPRNVENAAKKPEQTGGGEDNEERQPGEEGGPAEQEDKVHDTCQRSSWCLKCTVSDDVNKVTCQENNQNVPLCLLNCVFV